MTFIYGHSRSPTPTPTPTPTRTFRPNPHVRAGKNGEGEWEYIVGVNGVQMLHLLGLISHIWLSLSASRSTMFSLCCMLCTSASLLRGPLLTVLTTELSGQMSRLFACQRVWSLYSIMLPLRHMIWSPIRKQTQQREIITEVMD